MSTPDDLDALVRAAILRRRDLESRLHEDDTNCYRLFHGVVEGWPGLSIDRYGPLVLAQTFRGPLDPASWNRLEDLLAELVPEVEHRVLNHRGRGAAEAADASAAALAPCWARELGLDVRIQARHRGQDPWLFLDLRSARRWMRANARDQRVLNLFAYTCTMGLVAAAGGASRVCNVDFAASSLAVGFENAEQNRLPQESIQDDAVLVLRQLAGLPIKGRAARSPYVRREREVFDLVVLDPPRWARSRWGAVDVILDYPSLFKPAVLSTAPGGTVLATNHVAKVSLEDWLDVLDRCARKAGRPLKEVEVLVPEEDFPTFDGRPPLKIALCRT